MPRPALRNPLPLLSNKERERGGCAAGPGQRWPERMLETKGNECSREAVIDQTMLGCQPLLGDSADED